jgi:predicted amidohydrolase YtcJ
MTAEGMPHPAVSSRDSEIDDCRSRTVSAVSELLIHGPVFTADPGGLWAEAVVVRDSTIVFVGGLDAARAMASPDVEVVDASAGVVLPGFVDGHAHLLNMGASLMRAQLRSAASLEEISDVLQWWADANPTAERVLGLGWLFSSVPDGAPTRQMLDAVVVDRPVYLDANDLHAVWVNTAALRELGITDDTPDPVGGEIVRDADGHATGLLMENAGYHIAWPVMNAADPETDDRLLAAAIAAYLAAGTTTAVDMACNERTLGALLRAEECGNLPFTVVAHWLLNRTGDPVEELAQVAHAAQLMQRHATSRVRMTGVKLVLDGTIDGCTAGMLRPFANGAPGDMIWPRDALEPIVLAADAAGLQIAMHAIGDLAVRTAIDVLEVAAEQRAGRGDTRERRHRIEHLEYVDEADVSRLAALGITASMQPVHCDPAYLPNWVAMLGDSRADRGFAWPEFLAHGTTVAFGTDVPTAPHEPLPNMYIATTRKSRDQPDIPAYRPDWALPLELAVVLGTSQSAWASFLEHDRGMLRVGHAADITILDSNPFTSAATTLLDATVARTIVDGATVASTDPHRRT